MSNEIVKQKTRVNELAELMKWGELAVKGGVVPKSMSVFEAAAIIQTGKEMGISPFLALRNMYFVNGRIAMMVDLKLSMAMRHGVVVAERKEGDGFHEVTLQRGARKEIGRFTREDAKKAGLMGKDNWVKYETDMLRARATDRALDKICPDLSGGILSAEIARDLPDNGAGKLTATVVDVFETVQSLPEHAETAQNQPVPLTEADLKVDTAPPQEEPLKTQRSASEPVKRGRPFKLNAMQIQVSNAVKEFCRVFEIANELDFRHDLQRRHGVEHLNLATEAQCIAMIEEINTDTNDRMKE